jgi:hypothetical protein
MSETTAAAPFTTEPTAAAAPAAPAAPAPATMAEAAAAAAAAKPAAEGQPPAAAYLPEGLADQYKGASDKETIDKLWADISGRPKAPEKPGDYKLELPEALKGKIDPQNDAVLPAFREIAHRHGLDNNAFNAAIVGLYEAVGKSEQVAINAEFEALGQGRGSDQAARVEAGLARFTAVQQQLQIVAQRNGIAAELVGEMIGSMSSARSVQAMEAFLRLVPSETGPQGGGTPGGQPQTSNVERSLRAMYPSMFKGQAA